MLLALTSGIAMGVEVDDHRLRAGAITTAVVFGAWILLAAWVKARRTIRFLRSGLREIDAMTGTDFERYVAAKLRGAGYRVATTKVTGDFGVDLIASKGRRRIAIQCKRHGRPVGTAAVQQVVAGARIHNCSTTMVVSNQEFTPAAIRLADAHACELIGRRRLPRWSRTLR